MAGVSLRQTSIQFLPALPSKRGGELMEEPRGRGRHGVREGKRMEERGGRER